MDASDVWRDQTVLADKCLILIILTMVKYHENLSRNSALSMFSMAKYFSSLKTKIILEIKN